MQTVVVLTAASVSTLKHPCVRKQDLNVMKYQRALCMEAPSRDQLPDLK